MAETPGVGGAGDAELETDGTGVGVAGGLDGRTEGVGVGVWQVHVGVGVGVGVWQLHLVGVVVGYEGVGVGEEVGGAVLAARTLALE